MEVGILPEISGYKRRAQALGNNFPGACMYGFPLGTEGQRAAEMVEICVRDRGMGIASEYLERIFERFYRVDTALTRSVGALGLGLAISRRIIELHGGSIWAESWPGGGSTFCVRLPISQEETDLGSAEW